MSEHLKITPDEFRDQYIEYRQPDGLAANALVNVLRQIRRGRAASALDPKFPPHPIFSSLRTLRDGRRVTASTQNEVAGRLFKIIVEALDSGFA